MCTDMQAAGQHEAPSLWCGSSLVQLSERTQKTNLSGCCGRAVRLGALRCLSRRGGEWGRAEPGGAAPGAVLLCCCAVLPHPALLWVPAVLCAALVKEHQ